MTVWTVCINKYEMGVLAHWQATMNAGLTNLHYNYPIIEINSLNNIKVTKFRPK